jgi:uncharacterized protein (TIGR03066 family)
MTVGKGLPKGAILELKKDGKVVITATVKDVEQKIEGTYKVKGKAFELTTKRKDKERKQTIKVTKITDKALEVEDEREEALEFKRVEKKKEE